MNAPWVMDMRYMAQRDAEEAADYARERRASEIASDPRQLAAALVNREENDRWVLQLARVLTVIHTVGEPATPAQSLALSMAVQAIADDAARYEIEI